MVYKKQNWIKYNRPGRTGFLEVRDEDGKPIDCAKWLLSDKASESKIFTIFKKKYGVFRKPVMHQKD